MNVTKINNLIYLKYRYARDNSIAVINNVIYLNTEMHETTIYSICQLKIQAKTKKVIYSTIRQLNGGLILSPRICITTKPNAFQVRISDEILMSSERDLEALQWYNYGDSNSLKTGKSSI